MFRHARYALALFGVSFFVVYSWAADDGWVNLFNGKNLDGWVQRGGKAKYTVENGEIVGATVPNTPNSFLCTERAYGDFILELDFKVNDKLNSGVQIRSEYFEEPRTVDIKGKKVNIAAKRVHGYQIEIDPRYDRGWTGGIYDEQRRRKFLYDLAQNEPARKAFKHNDWNHFKIACKGDSIKTWLNGVPAADLKDDVTAQGFIALQVHGTKEKQPLEVRWRNIRLKELK